ncbi:MAG: hybrid sensor histidine kinase/response regulator [bacterium]|nr:hybrid sensor histidine kinase/response regulator [bacterium]
MKFRASIKKRILVVDDENIVRRFLKTILEEEYTIDTAGNGKEALEKLPVFNPDLIILDVTMPVMDGFETCKRIRRNEKFKFIKLVFLSGKVSREDRMNGYAAGADDYLIKPIDTGELLSKVKIFMRLKNAEEVVQLKKDILLLMSHETKTPLNGIFAPAQILINEPNLTSKEIVALANSINSSAQWLFENFKRIILLLKLKTGYNLYFSQGIPSDLVDISLLKLQAGIQEKQLSVKSKLEENLRFYADWDLISAAFHYMIDNAIKFSPKKGEVEINLKKEGNTCIISIRDQGEGMKPERVYDIFDEFSIEKIMHHHKGMGLSLAICNLIVLEHSGSIEVESEPYSGTCFTVTLPLNLKINE